MKSTKDITNIAVRKAIQDCKEKGLLTDFWKSLTPEEINMIGLEFDMATALEVEREEGYEKGLEKVALNMLKDGFSYEQISKLSMLDIEKVKELSYTIQR